MLIQFVIENYMSFRDETVLSMEASIGKEHQRFLREFKGEKILSSAVIFGENAAGKHNIIKAMAAAILAIRHSNSRQIDEPIPRMIPYFFDETSRNKPFYRPRPTGTVS